MNARHFSIAVCALLLASACTEPAELSTHEQRQALGRDVKVAAVQYATGTAAQVDSACSSNAMPDACAVGKLVAKARSQGAVLVVTPEYGLGQKYLEPVPTVGSNPGSDAAWTSGPLIKAFSQQAASLKVFVVIDLQTVKGNSKFNTAVAFDTTGKVVAVHHKFELFSSEAKSLTPGNTVSTFDTPAGKVGLLICADLYGDLRLHHKLVNTMGAKVVAVTSLWTAAGGWRWQQNYARNWGVHVVGSNTASGTGRGGGVFSPTGKVLAKHDTASPAITLAEIPAP